MWTRPLAFLGFKTLRARDIAVMTLRLLPAVFRSPLPSDVRVFQVCRDLARSLFFLVLTVGFLTAATVFQLCLQLGRYLGDPSPAGKGFVSTVLLAGPLLSSSVLALLFGSVLAAEASAAPGDDPAAWLAPRARAFALMTPVLGIWALAGVFAGGLLTAGIFDMNARLFLVPDAHGPVLAVLALFRLLLHGFVLPPAAAACGFASRQDGVSCASEAAPQALGAAFAAILISDVFVLACGWLWLRP